MSKNTAILHLQLKAADDTISSLRSNTVKATSFPNGNIVEREYTVGNSAVTHIGMASATLTVIVPNGKVDLNFTIGAATFTLTNVMSQVVLPGAITSVAMTASNTGDKVTVYLFQGS